MDLWPLVGIAVVVVGFALRLNALTVVTVAGIATGLAGGQGLVHTITVLGDAYIDNRYFSIIWFILPVMGLLERCGLREQARTLIGRLRKATTGRLLTLYLVFRQLTAAFGLTSIGGHPQMVRPLIAPMAEASSETRYGPLDDALRYRIRAHAAAVDNIGAFFGEDVFIAVGSILLMKGFLAANGLDIAPLTFAQWAIPSALCALAVQAVRLWLLDREIARRMHVATSSHTT